MNATLTWPDDAPPLKARHITLFGFVNRELRWAINVGEKRSLIAASHGKLYAAWTGEWSTHIFDINRNDAKRQLA